MATLATSGNARASVMPIGATVDPRLLSAQYGNILEGAGQGLQLVNNFNTSRQLALDRADANSLRDLRLAAQRGQLELEPQIQQDRAVISEINRLRAESTPIELAEGTSISRTPGGDILQLDTVTQIDPRTGQRDLVTRTNKPLAIAEDVAAKKALSDYRLQQADTAAALAEIRKGAEAEKAKNNAIRAALSARGLKIREDQLEKGVIGADLIFDRRSAQNDADINKFLGLKDRKQIDQFDNTVEGREIIDAINEATAMRFPVRLNDAQQQYLKTFRITPAASAAVTDMATQPPAQGSLPTAAAETLPAASPVRQALSPQDTAALQWAQANPNDPRATAIRQRLGQ